MRLLVFVILPLALLVAAGVYVALNPERVLGVDGEQLGSSLARETPEPGGGTCEREKGRRWKCGVEVDAGSGIARTYRLTTDGGACWNAVSKKGKRISGCVNLWDYTWPKDVQGSLVWP